MLKTLAVFETLRKMIVPNVPKILRKGEAAKAA
jgi:hypothetical protein